MTIFSARVRLAASSLVTLVIYVSAIQVAGQVALPATQAAPAGVATQPALPRTDASELCAACVRENLAYLAGPTLHGRGSGTSDERHAAEFIARKLKLYGLAPAAADGQFIQTANLRSRSVAKAPILSFDAGTSSESQRVSWKHGKEIAVFRLPRPSVRGPLQQLDSSDAATSPALVSEGAVLLLQVRTTTSMQDFLTKLEPYLHSKAALVIVPEDTATKAVFDRRAKEPPKLAVQQEKAQAGPDIVLVRPDAAEKLSALPAGTLIKLHTRTTRLKTTHTWNVLGKIIGSSEAEQVILLSAHLDHLGVKDGQTYPGADDDASGTVAVMELARALAAGPKPSRTVVFALWGSEELGAIGSLYFLDHPTFALKDIVANLEFEMIARPDPKLQRDQLWLSGWERTNLGPELAAQGAQLVGDPHPEQKFFTRSDNYVLAKQGIVAQTVSSYGLHKDYHQPTDTLSRVDWEHLDAAIGSLIGPVRWLVNSDFVPKWKEGQKP